MKKLSSYLSAGIAATATFQSSDAATIVTLYGPGARNTGTTPATPIGISIGKAGLGLAVDNPYVVNNSYFLGKSIFFTSGFDLGVSSSSNSAFYSAYGKVGYGAQLGASNYANISFNGNDGVHEAVGQFSFDGIGGGFLVALAMNNDNTALSISAGKLAIDAVPEPSAIALLALGAGGMAMRRRRKVA